MGIDRTVQRFSALMKELGEAYNGDDKEDRLDDASRRKDGS